MDSIMNTSNKKQKSKKKKAQDAGDGGGASMAASKKAQKDSSSSQPAKTKKRKTKDGKQSSKRAKKSSRDSPPTNAITNEALTPIAAATVRRPQYTGVTYKPQSSKYEARLVRGSGEYNLGLFDLACDAALAYDVASRITADNKQPGGGGNMLIANDVDEIKYTLNWLEHADNARDPKDADGSVNFTVPSQYRQARQKEQGDYLMGKIPHPSFNLKNVPREEELKVRIRKEILNLAKAYVAMQGVPPPAQEEEPSGQGSISADQGSESSCSSNFEGGDNKGTKKNVKSSLLKKKTWVPEAETTSMPTPSEEEESASRQEQAETLLALQKKRNNETKKVALAQKLEAIMNGGGDASNLTPNPTQENPIQEEQVKQVVDSSRNPIPTSNTEAEVGFKLERLKQDQSSLPRGEGGQQPVKRPEVPEERVTSNPSLDNVNPGVKSNEATLHQLQLKQLLQQQENEASLQQLQSNQLLQQQENESSLHQLQLNQLLQQQALQKLRASSAANAGNSGDLAARRGLAHHAPNVNPVLDQLLQLAAQRPDMVNENMIRQALQEQQQAREAAALRAAQIQASLMASGRGGQLQGQVRHSPVHTVMSPVLAGLQQQQPTPVPCQSGVPMSEPRREEAEKKQEASPEVVPSRIPAEPIKQEQEEGASDASVAALLASMGHRGPIPPGLAEHLQAALREQQARAIQQAGMMQAAAAATNPEENMVEDEEDPQTIMRRQFANEAKKAALAQRLSAHMAGSRDVQEALMKREEERQAAAHAQLIAALQRVPPQLRQSIGQEQGQINNACGAVRVKKESESNGQELSQKKEAEAPALPNREESYAHPDTQMRMAAKSASPNIGQSKVGEGHVPENVASASAAIALQQQQQLQALQALRGLSCEAVPEGIDEQALIQSLMLKKQMEEMNKQALEQKVQDYIQGKGAQQPSPAPAGMNRELTRNLALQTLLKEGGAQQNLQQSDLVRQAAIQTLLANQQRGQQQQQQQQQPQHNMGIGAANPAFSADSLTHDVVHRRIAIESMLMSEENRLRQLRETLQSQFVSHPQMHQMPGAGLAGQFGGAAASDPHHELMLERERQAIMANEEFRKAMINQEMNSSAAAVEQQRAQQEMALRQVLALRASQGAASVEAARAPVAQAGGADQISPERLLEAARNHGLDPQTMTAGQLAQLMGMLRR